MALINQMVATSWTFLLLSAFVCDTVLAKGGRGGSRGSSRGTSARSSSGGSHRAGAYGGTRSRYRNVGRSSPVRVASAAAAGAAVALTADNWYASAFRKSATSSEEDDSDYFNRTNYFDAQLSGSTQRTSSFPQVIYFILATIFPSYGYLWDCAL